MQSCVVMYAYIRRSVLLGSDERVFQPAWVVRDKATVAEVHAIAWYSL
jgi:hypothetical protein